MDIRSAARCLLCGCAALLVLALGWWGVSDGVPNWRHARTIGQHAEAALRLACGLLSVAVVVTRFWRRRFSRSVRIGWLVTLVAPAALSALVWGSPVLHVALLNAGVAVLVGWLALWALGPALAA